MCSHTSSQMAMTSWRMHQSATTRTSAAGETRGPGVGGPFDTAAGGGGVLVAGVQQGVRGRLTHIQRPVGVREALAQVDRLVLCGERGHTREDGHRHVAVERVHDAALIRGKVRAMLAPPPSADLSI